MMGDYKLIELGRDEQYIVRFDLIHDGKVILKSVKYRTAMDHLYEVMQEGDSFQEVFRDESRPILSFEQIQKSLSKREFDQKRKGFT